MTNKIFIWAIFFSMASWYPAAAQEKARTGTIVGVILDRHTGEPIPYASIYLPGLDIGDESDRQGYFHIERVPPGKVDLVVQRQGYQEVIRRNVAVIAGAATELTVKMESAVLNFDELVVTASRHANRAHEVPQMVTVASAAKIRDKGIEQTPEILREQAGISVQKTNHGGGSPVIRGFRANKLLLLIDGIRMNNSTYRGGNTQYLNSIAPFALDRVEVVHGPVSALYGSDALGGAINLLTRSPTLGDGGPLHWEGRAIAGLSSADNSRYLNAGVSIGDSWWGVLADFAHRSFGDIVRGARGGDELMRRLENDSRTERNLQKTQAPNAYDATDLTLKVALHPGETHQIDMAYQLSRQPSVPRYDAIETRSDSIWRYAPQERDLFYASYEHNRQSGLYHKALVTISLHRQAEQRIRQKFGSSKEKRDAFQAMTLGLQVQMNRLLGQKHFLVYGLEFYHDWIDAESAARNTRTGAITARVPRFPDKSTYANFGTYIQGEFALAPALVLQIGLRFSTFKLRAPFGNNPESAAFGTVEQSPQALTASIGGRYSLSGRVALVANLAQGFRAPNLDDVTKLGVGKGGVVFDIPNANVKPEETISGDFGLKIHGTRGQVQAMAFYNRIRDLLLRRPATFQDLPYVIEEGDTLQVFHKENAGKAYTTGFAAEAEFLLTDTAVLFGNLSTTYGQDQANNDALSAIPPLHGLLGIRWQRSSYWFEANWRFAAAQERLSTEDHVDLRIPEGGTPGWSTLNLRAGFTFAKNYALRLGLLNLLDMNYREHLSGFNAPGRNLYLGGEVRF